MGLSDSGAPSASVKYLDSHSFLLGLIDNGIGTDTGVKYSASMLEVGFVTCYQYLGRRYDLYHDS